MLYLGRADRHEQARICRCWLLPSTGTVHARFVGRTERRLLNSEMNLKKYLVTIVVLERCVLVTQK